MEWKNSRRSLIPSIAAVVRIVFPVTSNYPAGGCATLAGRRSLPA